MGIGKLGITSNENRRLQRRMQQNEDARLNRRMRAILLYDDGMPISEVAKTLRVSRQFVYNWIEKYAESRDLQVISDAERTGRPSLWTDDTRSALQAFLSHNPDQCGYTEKQWTAPLLQDALEGHTGWRPARGTVSRELARLGYVWRHGRYVHAPDKRRK